MSGIQSLKKKKQGLTINEGYSQELLWNQKWLTKESWENTPRRKNNPNRVICAHTHTRNSGNQKESFKISPAMVTLTTLQKAFNDIHLAIRTHCKFLASIYKILFWWSHIVTVKGNELESMYKKIKWLSP